jgi:hypothetical protein
VPCRRDEGSKQCVLSSMTGCHNLNLMAREVKQCSPSSRRGRFFTEYRSERYSFSSVFLTGLTSQEVEGSPLVILGVHVVTGLFLYFPQAYF